MSGPEPYWSDGQVTLYHGDMREVLPALGVTASLVIADPPYGETSLPWDQWPGGWLEAAAGVTKSMWCFGSLRMHLKHWGEFKSRKTADRRVWRLSQDVIWEKHNGSNFHADRFKRVHEQVAHWYRGPWRDIYRNVPVTADATARTRRSKTRPPHLGHIDATPYTSTDGGPRLMRSVIRVRSMHGKAIHATEKPPGILEPLITYACPPGGLVVDPFAGSGSTLAVAASLGLSAVGIEVDEQCCEDAAKRLCQRPLLGGDAA